MPETARTASFATELGVLRAMLKRTFGEGSPEVREVIEILLALQGEAERMDVIRLKMKGELDQGEIPDRWPRTVRETIRDLQAMLDAHEGGQATAA